MNVQSMQIAFTCLTAQQRLHFANRTKSSDLWYKAGYKVTLNFKSKWEKLAIPCNSKTLDQYAIEQVVCVQVPLQHVQVWTQQQQQNVCYRCEFVISNIRINLSNDVSKNGAEKRKKNPLQKHTTDIMLNIILSILHQIFHS